MKQNEPPVPWKVDVLPDFFGYHLLMDGKRFFIPKEQLESVIIALAGAKEREPGGSGWIDALVKTVLAQREELKKLSARDG